MKKSKGTFHGTLKPTAALLAAICVGLLPGGCRRKAQPPPFAAPVVAAITVRTQEIVLTTELPGRTSPYLIAEIRPQVGGIIQRRLFQEGSDVKAGEVLYQIDPAPYHAALDNAKASLARSEANLPAIRPRVERYRELLADKAVSQQDYDDAAAALKQAEADAEYWKAAMESARINLGYTRILAPISGRIGRSNITDGALVTAHQPMELSTIQQLDPMYVDVPQSTVALLRLKARLKDGRLNQDGTNEEEVKLILEDGTPYPLQGKLQFQDITVDPTTGSVILRILFPNPQGDLLPGMFVRAVVKEGVNKQAILIPHQCVQRDPKGNPTVMIVGADGKAQLRPLILDHEIKNEWLVASGLSPGDRVIAEGLLGLRPGTPVNVVPFDSAKSS